MLEFVRNMNIFCSEDLLWFKVIEAGYSSRKLQTTFRNVYGRHTDIVDKFDTSMWHICWRVWSPNATYDWFPVILCKSWRVPHVGQETLTLSGTPDFTNFGEFMISPIHYTTLVKKLRDNTYLNITWNLIPSYTYNNRCGQYFSFCWQWAEI